MPGLIEAEHYDAAFDQTPGNIGTAPGAGDVDLERTTDAGGGLNVGWIDGGEYLRYQIAISREGRYQLLARVASASTNGRFRYLLNGNPLGDSQDVPNTGTWQTWIDLSQEVELPAGTHELEINFEEGPFNLNYLKVIKLIEYRAVPAKIEAESYDDAFDRSPGNIGTAPGNDDVDLEATGDAGGGLNVGWIEAGEWLRYYVDVPSSGDYRVIARVASATERGAFHLANESGRLTDTAPVPNTGGWQSWQDVEIQVTLPAGEQALDVVFDGAEFNLNYLDIQPMGDAISLPAKIEAEDYHDAFDQTPGNEGGHYREDDTDIGLSFDGDNGYSVGWTDAGEWLAYEVYSSEARDYQVRLRIATALDNRTLVLRVNGNDAATFTLPNTGDWTGYTMVTGTVSLPAGQSTLQVAMPDGGLNFNWFELGDDTPPPPSGDWRLVWQDEFDGPQIDTSKWDFEVNGAGGGNNELQYYTDRPQNAHIQDGKLVIQALAETYTGADGTRQYTSARLRTLNKGDWRYGKFEIRARLPRGQGMWPAIWMLPTDWVYGGWAASGEIDIMEAVNVGGRGGNRIYGTLHYGGPWPQNVHTGNNITPAKDVSEHFHVYTVEWEEGEIRWYLDGEHYATQTEWWSSAAPYPAPFDRRFHMILNVAVGGTWPGSPDGSTQFPQRMEVDYVRVFERAE
ncbi:Carbohydrate-binding protein [Acanthopleuribacter pedis]